MVMLRVLAALLLAGHAAAALPDRSPVLPGMAGTDRRVRVDAAAAPWRALARLQAPGLMRCTAVFIAPGMAATAAHCLWSPRLGHWIPASALHLLPGYQEGGAPTQFTVSVYAVARGFDPLRPDASRGADIALLLASGTGPQPIPLAAASPAEGTPVVLAGYNQDHGEVIEADPACLVAGRARDGAGRPVLLHDCQGTRGTSGGPLLVTGPQGPALAGIQVGARQAAAGGVAVPVETLRRLLAGAPRRKLSG